MTTHTMNPHEDDPGLITAGPAPPVEVPTEGRHDAVLVYYKHEGIQWCHGKQVPCVRLYWQIAQRRANGKRFLVSKRFYRSLDHRSKLRSWLERWQHRPFEAREVQMGVTLDRYLTMACQLDISLEFRDGRRPWVEVEQLIPWSFTLGRHALTPEGVRPRGL